MDSIRDWADGLSYDYLRMGDAFLDIVSAADRAAIMARCPRPRLAITDLARLLWIDRLLADGHPMAAWFDADILVVDPAALALPAQDAVARELWMWLENGRLRSLTKASNCGLAIVAGSPLLADYLAGCRAILDGAGPIDRLAFGPALLTRIAHRRRVPAITGLATISPLLLGDMLTGPGRITAAFRNAWAQPIHAVHLCRSLGPGGDAPDRIGAGVHQAAVDRLCADPGLLLR